MAGAKKEAGTPGRGMPASRLAVLADDHSGRPNTVKTPPSWVFELPNRNVPSPTAIRVAAR